MFKKNPSNLMGNKCRDGREDRNQRRSLKRAMEMIRRVNNAEQGTPLCCIEVELLRIEGKINQQKRVEEL